MRSRTEVIHSSASVAVSGPDSFEHHSIEECREINYRAFEYYSRLAKVQKYVEENLGNEIYLAIAASVAATEKTYFCTFFRRKVGVGFRTWLEILRIQRSLSTLISSDVSITEVSLAVGFKDLRTFERAFKKYLGITPSRFRNEHGFQQHLTRI
jgi:AraC-like DNA-binding protein